MTPGVSFSTAGACPFPPSRRSILLVEDEDAFRTLLTDVLLLDGHAVHACSDGRLALRYLERHTVDLIVTDLCMPDCDGFELLIKLRERGGGAAVLVMSGGIGSQVDFYLKTARQLGATRTLEKPFPLEKLLANVRGMLAERG
jgi:DNA-binding response OmpR family regulator